MSMSNNRWQVIAESNFPWEREALEWLRSRLPDRDPWGVWTNFEFIDDEGKINEVDALVLSPAGLFLVEIKSRPGVVHGDAHTWSWTTDGREYTYDNPLILANRKAKRLASLLRRQASVVKAKIRLPFVEPVIFLSSTSLKCQLQGIAKTSTFMRGQPGAQDDDGIVAALMNGISASASYATVDGQQARAIARGLADAGIRPSNKHRQVGDYKLTKLIGEGGGYQDWQSQHVSIATVQRRIRIYTVAKASSPEARATCVRQAHREFEILEGIAHPGILKVNDLKETEMGPALIFDHDPKAQRLDHLLRDRGAQLTLTERLHLVRDIAETLKYAHSRRLYHRALGPQSIIVHIDEAAGTLAPQLMNWQTAARDSSILDTVHRTAGTRFVGEYVEDPGLVYLAPETAHADSAHGPSLDIFSLGAIAYQVFSGQVPAGSALELAEKLRLGQGLRLSDVMDGCGKHQQDLIQYATSPDVMARYNAVQEFLDDLAVVEDELTTPDPETTVDPSRASQDDRLEGGFTVIKRVGRGSSSDVNLVREDGSQEELILKVATNITHNERLVAEGEVLAKLRHPNIVEFRRTLTVAGRTGLLMRSAGAKTLAKKISEDGRLSLDLLQRFGEELIEVARHLEDEGVAHRDIKPENIGIREASSRKLQLVVFDFSLCRTPVDNISAGTPPYLDPFLSQRKRQQWDLYAERYAVAVTLYEMAIGRTPVWGDGHTAPTMLDVEATIASDVFNPALREGFTAFFAKALRRHVEQRHDNAEEMLRAWRAIFTARQTQHPPQQVGFAAIALTATDKTTMAELMYSLEAQDVLDRMGVHNARELLAVDRVRFRYLRGVGDKIRKEIRLKAKELVHLRPDLAQGLRTLHDGDDDQVDDDAVSVNELAAHLFPRRSAADDRPEDTALAHYLGLDADADADTSAKPTNAPTFQGRWPSLGESAQLCGVERSVLTDELIKARIRWLKKPAFTALRNELEQLLRRQGQVMTTTEAALALLAMRGCAIQDEAERMRLSSAVLRAALEAEAHLEQARFECFDHAPSMLIASSPDWADYARQLGTIADTCAMAEPLMPPARALEALEAIRPAAGGPGDSQLDGSAGPMSATRLLRLATSASRKAALSSRQEIYSRGMPALQALRQSLGALVGTHDLSVADLQERVRGRYPDALPLPGRPQLDRLLEEVGAPLQWQPGAANGAGAFGAALLNGDLAGANTTKFSRLATFPGAGLSATPELAAIDAAIAEANDAEVRLQRSLTAGGMLVLTVEPRQARHAEAELLRRFDSAASTPLQRLSFDSLLLAELHAQARAANIHDWNIVLRADAAEPGSRDWVNLQRLVLRALATIKPRLLNNTGAVLLTNVGLLARYELMALVTDMEAAAGRAGHTPALWLLLPSHKQGLPVIDGVSVPLINSARAFNLPRAWITNQHRATAACS
jgi:serine/threonine protein kinase